MMLQFSLENYLSFRERGRIGLVAGSIKEFPENTHVAVQYSYDTRLLKSICLYGKNSSGKSNVLKGFSLMKNLVLNSVKDSLSHDLISVDPFKLNDQTEIKSSLFEVVFIVDDTRYRYGFLVNKVHVEQEWLYFSSKVKEDLLFQRVGTEYRFSKLLQKGENKTKVEMLRTLTRDNALFISILDQFNIEIGKSICNWFSGCRVIHDSDNFSIINHTAKLFHAYPDYARRINAIIENADLGIKSIKTTMNDSSNTSDFEKKLLADFLGPQSDWLVKTRHEKYSGDKVVKEEEFDMRQNESLGTQKFFGLLGFVIESLKNGTLLVVDELDSRLHTLLLEKILGLYNSEDNASLR